MRRLRLDEARLPRLFIFGAAAILAITGLGKLLSTMGEVDILREQDPLFTFLTNRQVMFSAALMELGVAGFMLASRDTAGKLGVIASLGMVFLTYRVGLWAIGYEAPCSCLGAFTEAIGLSAPVADMIMKGVLAYLLLGSLSLLAVECFRSRGRVLVDVNDPSGENPSTR